MQQTHQRANESRAADVAPQQRGGDVAVLLPRSVEKESESSLEWRSRRAGASVLIPAVEICVPPLIIFPQYSGRFDPRFISTSKTRTRSSIVVTVATLPAHRLSADKIRVFSSAMSVDRGVFSFRSARGSASAS